jgi:cell division protein YceG involved in septum cleavage
MKKRMIAVVILLIFTVVSIAFAVNTYQVTGPVLEVKDTSITVQKGNEKWEIARDSNTKVTGDLKVGSKVTIKYEMKAVNIDAKEEAKRGSKK